MLSSGKAVHKLQQTSQCVQGLFGRRKKNLQAQKEKLTMCIHDHLGPAIFKRKKITTFFVRQCDTLCVCAVELHLFYASCAYFA